MPVNPQDNKTELLILQHPQEPDKELGSAGIAVSLLKNSKLKIGLSWPNFQKALGRPAERGDWIVLYLGSVKLDKYKDLSKPALLFTDKKNNIRQIKDNEHLLQEFRQKKSRGIILIDGTWSQAKTIWWRNAWLNKLHRCVLLSGTPSLYGKLRKEPKKECLSTVESAAYAISLIDRDPTVFEALMEGFKEHLSKFKK